MAGLSCILIVRDEAARIERCLRSVAFADEVVVLDTGSTDATPELARRHTDRVYRSSWKGYGGTKQAALEKATGEWILWIDADEIVPAGLAEEIRGIVDGKTPYAGFHLSRKAYFLGRWMRYGGWYPGHVIRLFRRDCGRFSPDRVHEGVILTGKAGFLKHPLDHYTDDSIGHYFDKFNRYTSLAAADLAGRGRRPAAPELLLRPLFMFLRMYVIRLGFLDGMEGFLLALFSSQYVFAKYAKGREAFRPPEPAGVA
ncbi:glycosyltransferase family 2 protein [bacterium]|nr:glycosyltransferase family 2 protein [bacterium]